ncbi:hypothetical protein PybrP1_005459 [[Pythium] brassicae (nom. inval.)]|nr:hypothetical protein PybrP1_005459 [[Pythium] brassicae (nom. inval.)]
MKLRRTQGDLTLTLQKEAKRSDERADDAEERATLQHRDEIVAAILTISSALGLARETLHLCVDVLDRFLDRRRVAAARLEMLGIACLWIAVKFVETPATIVDKSIKKMLQQRRHSGNWTWAEILAVETDVLRELNFRVMAPTTLALLQKRMFALAAPLAPAKARLACYFADLLLLRGRSREFAAEQLVATIWYVVSEHRLADVQPPLLAPVVLLFLAHRDNINPKHAVFKPWFALRCHYGAFLAAPWQVPYDACCICRVCEHVQDEQDRLDEQPADPELLLASAKQCLQLVS